jgi:lysophospholipid acyltransferase (LPLAT)-like uncharacterized protein
MKEHILERREWKERALAFVIYLVVRALWASYRVRITGQENRQAAAARASAGQTALACWHEHTLAPACSLRGERLVAMSSFSRDGRLSAATLQRFGFHIAFGSSSRGGFSALREMIKKTRQGYHAAITVDGPRGPRREVKGGILEVARVARLAIVPVSYAAERAWRLRSWDRFVIPKPFSRVNVHFGEPIFWPEEETATTFDEMGVRLASALNEAEVSAQHALDAFR